MGEYRDRLEHARALAASGRPESAYAILCAIPQDCRLDLGEAVAIADEKHACLLAMDRTGDPQRRLWLFNAALMLFYQITEIEPGRREVYERQAAFWRRIGDSGMAERVLRTGGIGNATPTTDVGRDFFPPIDAGTNPAPRTSRRILFITHPRPHFGLDVLYDGLCAVLGDENVVEYPWKPILHGEPLDGDERFPCACNRRGPCLDLDAVLAELGAGRFDVVLFGDMEKSLDRAAASHLTSALGATPLFLLDQQDECVDFQPEMKDFLDGLEPAGYFKREMLACADYGPRSFPLPMACPDDRVWAEPSFARGEPLFWAGQRWSGLRAIYLAHIERALGRVFDRRYGRDEYLSAMRNARIGLSAFGAGFDTVRYWELPAQGCLLFAESSPIRIPFDFRDGISAVFFRDVGEFREKFEHYLANPDECERIARAGHDHLRECHTGSARARQLLAHVEAILNA